MLHRMNWIRGIAATMIVFLHMNTDGTYTFGPNEEILLRILGRETTCIFLAISGFFFQLNLHKYTFRRYLTKKFQNVILPYVIVSAPAILIYLLQLKTTHVWIDLQALSRHGVAYQVLFFLATGAHLGPFWFIPVLSLLFVAAPIFEALSRSRLFPIIVAICLLFSMLGERPAHDSSNPLLATLRFFPFYLFGMLVCRYGGKVERSWGIVIFGFATIGLSLVAWTLPNLLPAQKLALFLFLYFLLSAWRAESEAPGGRIARILSIAGNFSFSIYLLHGYFSAVAALLARNHLSSIGFASFLSIRLATTVLVVLLCVGIAMPIKKAWPDLSRQLVGA